MIATPRATCRACDAPLCEPWFTGGDQPVYWTKATADQHVDLYPLNVAMCSECGLVQTTQVLSHSQQTGEIHEEWTRPSDLKHRIKAHEAIRATVGEDTEWHWYEPSWGDPVEFVRTNVGDTNHVAVLELPYAGALLTGRLDILRHTQATYWTVYAWHQAMKRIGCIVLNVQRVDRQGGMIRVYCGRPEWYRHAPGCEAWLWWEELADLQFDGFDIAVKRMEAHRKLVKAHTGKRMFVGFGDAQSLARQEHLYGTSLTYLCDPGLREDGFTHDGRKVCGTADGITAINADVRPVLDPNDPKAAMDALLDAKWTGTATILAPGIRTVQVNAA